MRVTSIIGLLLCLCHWSRMEAQCGAIGNNLFQAGDFGSGANNNLLLNPNIAPGYDYVTSGPPSDGEYILTNNTGAWSNLYGTWLPIQDNSMNTSGYMMVVNASFDPGLFYSEEVSNLCENTTFEFTADIINLIRIGVADHIDPNVDFLIDDEVVLRTGTIPKNETWNTYSFEFSTAPGQTSVILSLRNNAPGGIGNDLALDNIAFRACGPGALIRSTGIENFTVCSEEGPVELQALLNGIEEFDQSYVWETSTTPTALDSWTVLEGQTTKRLEISDFIIGINYYRFGTAGSPANIRNANCIFYSAPFLIEVPQRMFELNDTLCGGLPLPFDMGEMVTPGLFVLELESSIGCDSIVMIQLDTIQRATINAAVISMDPTCGGQASGSIKGNDIMSGYAPYYIEVDGIPFDDLIAEGLNSGIHQIRVVDRYGCFFSQSVTLEEPPELMIDLGPDLDIILGEEITLMVESNLPLEQIIWSGLSDSIAGESVQLLPLNDGIIRATGLTADGCQDDDEVNINVNTEARIYIPNAFSPNADLTNDEYYISPFGRSLGGLETFIIFDRWGNKVWETNDPGQSWDGKSNGENLMEGIYPYYLRAFLINGDPIEMRGSIQLIR